MLASHELVFQTLFAQVEDAAFSQALIPLESPGLKIEREVKGIDYIYWRRTLAGRREAHLLGPQSLAQKNLLAMAIGIAPETEDFLAGFIG